MDNNKIPVDNAVAVVGIGLRMPGAKTVDAMWENLMVGKEAVSYFSAQDAIQAGANPAEVALPEYVCAAALLEDIDHFDPRPFGLAPIEAQIMDPQQRLFLECAWEALEQASYSAMPHECITGIFACTSTSTYQTHLLKSGDLARTFGATMIETFNTTDMLPLRLGYIIDAKGPCIAIQNGCTSSLSCVHAAVQNLLSYQCDLAVAGGASIRLYNHEGYLFQEGGQMSPDGHCRPFDIDACGTVGGNGVGVVALMRLEDAIEQKAEMYAVIRGSSINNGGAERNGFTAPSFQGQAAAVRDTLAIAGVNSESVCFIEAQASATPMGDALEFAALTDALGGRSLHPASCALGSLKPNFGNLDTASGIAGLIKAILILHYRAIPPTINHKALHPDIDAQHSPLYINTAPVNLHNAPGPLRAGVNNFGIGGTNAFVLLEEAPAAVSTVCKPSGSFLFPLSAYTPGSLLQSAGNLSHYLGNHNALSLADTAYTLQVGRKEMPYRACFIASNVQELQLQCLAFEGCTQPVANTAPRIAFMLDGAHLDAVESSILQYSNLPPVRCVIQRLRNSTLGNTQGILAACAYFESLIYLGIEPCIISGRGRGEGVIAYLKDKVLIESGVCQESDSTNDSWRTYRCSGDNTGTIDVVVCLHPEERKIVYVPGISDQTKWLALTALGPQGLLRTLAELWIKGCSIRWDRLYDQSARRVILPTYAFEHSSYWMGGLDKSNVDSCTTCANNFNATGSLDELLEIIRSCSGYDFISPAMSFHDLALSSLLIIQILSNIQQHFHKPALSIWAYDGTTFAEMYQALSCDSHSPPPSHIKTLEQRAVPRIGIHTLREGTHCVIMFPPFTGTSREYGKGRYSDILEHLAPLHGMYNITLHTTDFASLDMKDIARLCADKLVDIVHDRQYVLAGWCNGGILALETARTLKNIGFPARAIVLVDTYEPTYLKTLTPDVQTDELLFLQSLMIDIEPDNRHFQSAAFLDELRKLPVENRFSYLHAEMQEKEDLSVAELEQLCMRYTDMYHLGEDKDASMLSGYCSMPYNGPVELFRAAASDEADASLGWGHVFNGDFNTHHMACNHLVMFYDPYASQIADVLNKRLEPCSS